MTDHSRNGLVWAVLCVSILLPSCVFGQVPVKEDLLETVNYLYPYIVDNGELTVKAGTGFAVKHLDTGQSFLVTAKHVLTQKSGAYFPNLCIRQGKKQGADFIPIKLSGRGAARAL